MGNLLCCLQMGFKGLLICNSELVQYYGVYIEEVSVPHM